MPFTSFQPESLEVHSDQILVNFSALLRIRKALCPFCHQPSTSVHSRYLRTISDLPLAGFKVVLRVKTARFRCLNPDCPHRTFTQPLDNLAARYARPTNRQLEHLRSFGLALGGEAGARLAHSLGFRLSSATLLRLLRALPLPQFETPRVLGVDEWALRKGHNYGTLLYDLERHRPIELLEGRSPRSFADWLVAHPGIEIISRDRSSGYGEGAKLGAPKALQVADRWHLWQNLSDCVKRLLGGYYTPITDFYKAHPLPPSLPTPAEATLPPVQLSPKPASKVGSRTGELKPIHPPSQVRRQLRLHIYEQVKSLKAQGLSNGEIARELKVHKQTVRRYVAAPHFPEQAPPSFKKIRTSQLQPYHTYLLDRWKAGCHNHRQRWRELVEQGYRGGFVSVYIYIRQRREKFPLEYEASELAPVKKEFKSRGAVPTLRQISWWITSQREKLEERQQVGLQSLLEQWPELEKVYELVQEFAKIMRERQVGKLKEWVGKAEASELKELAGFANGIRRDQQAVEASLKYPWSNGPVEGNITRLKLIKRQGYGRAKLDLLKVRVIMAA